MHDPITDAMWFNPAEVGKTTMTIKIPPHRIVKNTGFCICRAEPFNTIDVNLLFMWHLWCPVKIDTFKSLDAIPYILAISINDDYVYPVSTTGSIRAAIDEGKQYICGIRNGYKTVPIGAVSNLKIIYDFAAGVKGGQVRIMNTEDTELIEATEELNAVDTKEEVKKECKEDMLNKCKTCMSYIPSYNVCAKTVSPITDVKACTAYEYRRGT
jgi:hypothetical protein